MGTSQPLLTILFGNVFARRDKVSKALKLITSHGPAALDSQVLLKMRVEVLLEGEVAHKSHTADAAVEFDALEDLGLRLLGEPEVTMERIDWLIRSDSAAIDG